MSENYLPLILVSAVDSENATNLISEIIDHEVMDTDRNLRGGRVWRIINKYYRADVELCAAADGAQPPRAAQRLEAHVLHVTEQECAAAEAAETRWAGAGAAARGAEVRLLAVQGARTPPALAGWARRRGYEAVPLAECATPDGDAAGVARLREALHAHPWRGLARLDRTHADSGAVAACGGEAEAAESDSEAEEAAAVERAEAFVEALGALADAGGGAGDDAERRLRAERLVAAFCRALGAELQLSDEINQTRHSKCL